MSELFNEFFNELVSECAVIYLSRCFWMDCLPTFFGSNIQKVNNSKNREKFVFCSLMAMTFEMVQGPWGPGLRMTGFA